MTAPRPERSAELRELIQAHGADPDDPRLGGDEASVRETLALSRQFGISLRPQPSAEERAEVLFSPAAPAMLQAIAAAKAGRGDDRGKTPDAATQSGAMDQADADRKIVATLVARAALAGYELVQLGDGTFIVSRFGLFRSLDHIAAVEAFLRRVEPRA